MARADGHPPTDDGGTDVEQLHDIYDSVAGGDATVERQQEDATGDRIVETAAPDDTPSPEECVADRLSRAPPGLAVRFDDLVAVARGVVAGDGDAAIAADTGRSPALVAAARAYLGLSRPGEDAAALPGDAPRPDDDFGERLRRAVEAERAADPAAATLADTEGVGAGLDDGLEDACGDIEGDGF